jgi:hypothetical protein
MRKYSYCFWVVLMVLLACDSDSDMEPITVDQYMMGEMNARPFESKITVEMGACIRKDLCDKEVIWIHLGRKIQEETYQMVFFEYIHCTPGNYFLKDSLTSHRKDGVCTQESVYAMSSFKADPRDDIYMDSYRLVEGPWNHLRIRMTSIS